MIDTNTSVMSFIYSVRRQDEIRMDSLRLLLLLLLLLHGFQVGSNYLRLCECAYFICFLQSSSSQPNSIFKCLPSIFHTLAPRFSCLHLEHFRSKASMLPACVYIQYTYIFILFYIFVVGTICMKIRHPLDWRLVVRWKAEK